MRSELLSDRLRYLTSFLWPIRDYFGCWRGILVGPTSFFIGEKCFLHCIVFTRQTSLQRSASLRSLQFDSLREDLSWHASKGRQLEITFGDTVNRSVADTHHLSDVASTFACTWLVFLWTDHVSYRRNVHQSASWLRSATARLSSHRWSCLINTATDRLQTVKIPLLSWIFCFDSLGTQALFSKCLNSHLIFESYPTHIN